MILEKLEKAADLKTELTLEIIDIWLQAANKTIETMTLKMVTNDDEVINSYITQILAYREKIKTSPITDADISCIFAIFKSAENEEQIFEE
ncbi:MAG: hypothetical protein U9Q66_02905 [Patescibacteria group bacterium]|nr:hypothetical protein [Patescibacteria group bacterium]